MVQRVVHFLPMIHTNATVCMALPGDAVKAVCSIRYVTCSPYTVKRCVWSLTCLLWGVLSWDFLCILTMTQSGFFRPSQQNEYKAVASCRMLDSCKLYCVMKVWKSVLSLSTRPPVMGINYSKSSLTTITCSITL